VTTPTRQTLNVFMLPLQMPGPDAVLYRPIRTTRDVDGECDGLDMAARWWDQLARDRTGVWLYRTVTDPVAATALALPQLLPPDLAHKLERTCELTVAWDQAEARDDEHECTRLNACLDVLATDEMTLVRAALSEAYFRWKSARRHSTGAADGWIPAPRDLTGRAEAYRYGRRPRP